jgi:hypothetical protein
MRVITKRGGQLDFDYYFGRFVVFVAGRMSPAENTTFGENDRDIKPVAVPVLELAAIFVQNSKACVGLEEQFRARWIEEGRQDPVWVHAKRFTHAR